MLAEFRHPLHMLGITGFGVLDEDLALIVRTWGGLIGLGIGLATVTGQGLRTLLSLPKLKSLYACRSKGLEEAAIRDLLQQLEQIAVSDCQWKETPSAELQASIEAHPYSLEAALDWPL